MISSTVRAAVKASTDGLSQIINTVAESVPQVTQTVATATTAHAKQIIDAIPTPEHAKQIVNAAIEQVAHNAMQIVNAAVEPAQVAVHAATQVAHTATQTVTQVAQRLTNETFARLIHAGQTIQAILGKIRTYHKIAIILSTCVLIYFTYPRLIKIIKLLSRLTLRAKKRNICYTNSDITVSFNQELATIQHNPSRRNTITIFAKRPERGEGASEKTIDRSIKFCYASPAQHDV